MLVRVGCTCLVRRGCSGQGHQGRTYFEVREPRVWRTGGVQSLSRPTRRRVLRRPRPLTSTGHDVGHSWSRFKAIRWPQCGATVLVGALPSEILEIDDRMSILWNDNFSSFFGAEEFPNKRQNASVSSDKILEILVILEILEILEISCLR